MRPYPIRRILVLASFSQTSLFLAVLLVSASESISAEEQPPIPGTTSSSLVDPDRSHAEMLKTLHKIAEADRMDNPYYSERDIRDLEQALADSTHPPKSMEQGGLLAQLGQAYLDYGDIEKAVTRLNEAYLIFADHPKGATALSELTFGLGLAFLRLAENENCCANHTPASCILPIRGEALHQQRRGSETAVRYFQQVINSKATRVRTRLKSIWLLNLAHMTLGEYPDKVPKEFLVPPGVFQSKSKYPEFVNVAAEMGLDTNSMAGGVVVDDFDGDNDFDILVSSWDMSDSVKYFVNEGPAGFVDRSVEAGLEGYPGGLNMTSADYDNDGDLDVYISRGAWLWDMGKRPDSLLQNLGDGTFLDVTYLAGMGRANYPSQTSAWADYDNDGDLDLFVGNEHSKIDTKATADASGFAPTEAPNAVAAPCQLFRNNGDGTFTDVAEAAGVTNLLFTKGCSWGDLDGDRWPDLVVSNFGGANRLYHNRHDGTFVNIAAQAGIEEPNFSFPVWTWDYDNDGVLDIFFAPYKGSTDAFLAHAMGRATPPSAGHYRGNGDLTFENRAATEGLRQPLLSMGANFGDINNDGFPDFYVGTGQPDISELVPNQMFYNNAGKGFVDVTMAARLGHLQKGHAIAFADLDRDGDLDIFEQLGGAKRVDQYRDALFANPGTSLNWLEVKLVGTKSNRSGIGARIKATVVEGETRRSIYQHVNTGASFGANPLTQHLGVGRASHIEQLEVFWPTSNTTHVFHNVRANQMIEITEGSDSIRLIPTGKILSRNTPGRPTSG